MPDFGARIGPLPAYAWGGMIGVAVLGYQYWHKSSTSIPGVGATPVAPSTDPSVVPGTPNSLNPIDGAFTPGTANGSPLPTTNPSGSLSNNQTWLQQGIEYLTGMGTNALAAQQALQNYLNGSPLSTTDQASVNKYLTYKGLPPDGVSGTPVVNGPTAAQEVARLTVLQQAEAANFQHYTDMVNAYQRAYPHPNAQQAQALAQLQQAYATSRNYLAQLNGQLLQARAAAASQAAA